MEISIDIEKGHFSVTADISSGEVLREAINNFFTAYFNTHRQDTGDVNVTSLSERSVALTADEEALRLGVYIMKDRVVANSRSVANAFSKKHKTVMRDIRNLHCTAGFAGQNFVPGEYLDKNGQVRPEILMTRDGFMFLVMGYTGALAGQIKETYIRAFNTMEEELNRQQGISRASSTMRV